MKGLQSLHWQTGSNVATETLENKKEELLDSLAKGLSLLRLFAQEGRSMTMQEVAEKLDVTRAAARRLLLTLVDQGYVSNDGRHFSVTPRVIELGYAYFAAMDLPTVAGPAMRALSARINENCSLAVLDGPSIVLIARQEPQHLIRLDMWVGRRMPAYANSLGRALLAYLEPQEWEDYLARTELRKLTPFTETSREALEKKLARVRSTGYCVLVSELVDGLAGVSLPIRQADGKVLASLGVTMVLGSRTRKQIVDACLPALRAAAYEIEALLHARAPGPGGTVRPCDA